MNKRRRSYLDSLRAYKNRADVVSMGGRHRGKMADRIYDALDRHFWGWWTGREIKVEGIKQTEEDDLSRMDYWAIHFSFGWTCAVEIKTARSDFKSELRHPLKQRGALRRSNRFYFCAPKGLIKPAELPSYAGLLEYEAGAIRETVKAPWRDAMAPTWSFVAAIIYEAHFHDRIRNDFAQPPTNKLNST